MKEVEKEWKGKLVECGVLEVSEEDILRKSGWLFVLGDRRIKNWLWNLLSRRGFCDFDRRILEGRKVLWREREVIYGDRSLNNFFKGVCFKGLERNEMIGDEGIGEWVKKVILFFIKWEKL